MAYVRIMEIGGNKTIVEPDGSTRRVVTWEGLSTDPVPRKADGARNGHRRYLKDTQEAFTFDEDADDWYPL